MLNQTTTLVVLTALALNGCTDSSPPPNKERLALHRHWCALLGAQHWDVLQMTLRETAPWDKTRDGRIEPQLSNEGMTLEGKLVWRDGDKFTWIATSMSWDGETNTTITERTLDSGAKTISTYTFHDAETASGLTYAVNSRGRKCVGRFAIRVISKHEIHSDSFSTCEDGTEVKSAGVWTAVRY